MTWAGVAAGLPRPPAPNHSMVQRLAFSDDGIQWREADENPVFRGRSDTHNCLVYNRQRDVFMSLGAEDDGYALTVPLECPGKRLHINARNGREGFVKVAVRRGDGVTDGNRLTSYGYDRMVAFTGDSTNHPVVWKDSPDLSRWKGRSIRLHFWLRDAQLYSFWFA